MNINKEIKPKLNLFLSVDVIGSTAYKNSAQSESKVQPWLGFFWDFYRDFPLRFKKECDLVAKGIYGQTPLPTPDIWKSLGDELIFVKEISHPDLVYRYIKAFRNSVINYRKEIEKKLPLSLKITAWTAGFPVINSEIKTDPESKKLDYIGPQIDIGFRLSKYSNYRKFVISVELALLLSNNSTDLKFFFDGRIDIKGVSISGGYPLFWIDMYESGDYRSEEDKFLNVNSVDQSILKDYLIEFLRTCGDPFFIPFIRSEEEHAFKEEPPGYNEKFMTLKELYFQLEYKKDIDGTYIDLSEYNNKLSKINIK